jgi:hypothetical protein
VPPSFRDDPGLALGLVTVAADVALDAPGEGFGKTKTFTAVLLLTKSATTLKISAAIGVIVRSHSWTGPGRDSFSGLSRSRPHWGP